MDVTKFNEWREVQNHTFPTDQVPSDLLTHADIESATLCKWLSHFVAETRNGKGEECTPATISQLLASIPRHMHNHNPDTPNFMDRATWKHWIMFSESYMKWNRYEGETC